MPVKDPVNGTVAAIYRFIMIILIGKYVYAYNIDVLRLDGDENETKTWSIVRYEEYGSEIL